MKRHVEFLRFWIVEELIGLALRIVPRDTREARELAIFITHSWMARDIVDYKERQARIALQAEWKRKLQER
jgi:uncharacterized protein involved in cysteine biosynthesis